MSSSSWQAPAASDTQPLWGDAHECVVLRCPQLTPAAWYRVVALRHHRGDDAYGEVLLRFARHVTAPRGCTAAGQLVDLPHLAARYRLRYGLSVKTFWNDLRRACEAGLIRATAKAAPGRAARYELQLPTEQIPARLPEDLAAALGVHPDVTTLPDVDRATRLGLRRNLPEPDHTDTHKGHLTATPLSPPLRLDPPQLVDPHPTSPEQDPDHASACYPLHTSPSLRGADSPSWFSPDVSRQTGHDDDRGRGAKPPRRPIAAAEITDAAAVLDRCADPWRRQRPPGTLLSRHERAQLAPLVALALRRTTPGALLELLTDKVASAESLTAVCVTRLWRLIRATPEHAWRRETSVPIDDHGHRAEALRAARAATAAAAAETRETVLAQWRPRLAAATAATDTTSQAEQARHAHLRARYGTPTRITEPPEDFHRDHPHPDEQDQDDKQTRRDRIHQAARLRAAHERATRRPQRSAGPLQL